MIELIRCNMDIQFLGSGPSTKAIIYYITDYITKAQLKTHVAYAALALAVQKLEQIDKQDDLPTITAKKLLQKCAFSMVARQELSGQQVASYLMDLEDHFSSHAFEPLYWTNFERIVNTAFPTAIPVPDEDIDDIQDSTTNEANETGDNESQVFPEHDDPTIHADEDDLIVSADNNGELEIQTPYVQDYLLRGANLKPLSLWEYRSFIQKVSKKHAQYHDECSHHARTDTLKDDINNDSHARPKYAFDCRHPNYSTHVQQLRHPQQRPIPMPIGPSLPRRDKIENREKYCRLMLLFLKPWNTPQDLILGYDSFETAFQTFLQENSRWKSLLDNMQLLHECRDHRDDHFADRSRNQNSQPSFEGIGNDTNDNDDFELTDPSSVNAALLSHLTSIDDSRSLHMTESQHTIDQCLQQARAP
jgi:hypothetical protein